MKRRKRFVWTVLALVVIVAIAGAWWWTGAHQAPPQIITLPNGDRYQFAGTTYSTRNVPPSMAAKLVSWVPARPAALARKYFGARVTQYDDGKIFESPQLFVWFRRIGTNAPPPNLSRIFAGVGKKVTLFNVSPSFNAILADQAGIEGGEIVFATFPGSVAWCYASFPIAPRRSRVIKCNLYPFGGAGKPHPPLIGSVSFPNPRYGHFRQWQPDLIPSMKQSGDVEVQLQDFMIGVPGFIGSRQPVNKGQEAQVSFYASLNSANGANEQWLLHSSEISDATGNILHDSSLRRVVPSPKVGPNSYGGCVIGTLWPGESAWRLKLRLKHVLGFAPEDLVRFKNVPVPAMGTTNTTPITNSIGGIQLVLAEFARNPNLILKAHEMSDRTSWIRVELPGKPAGVALDFLKITTDTGKVETAEAGYFAGDFDFVQCLQSIPSNAQTVDITLVVQKTRTVEFLVKPPKPG